MAALAQMTAVINAELSGTTAAGTDALAPATGERLERWIERLVHGGDQFPDMGIAFP